MSEVDGVTLVDPTPGRRFQGFRDRPKVNLVEGSTANPPAGVFAGHDVVVLAAAKELWPAGEAALEAGAHVVTTCDDPALVRRLLSLDSHAQERGLTVAVGAAMSPGLTCVLAAFLAQKMQRVSEIHVARFGTGGNACAHRHHDALAAMTVDWREGGWRRQPGGSGRELVWFPEPIGGRDCYRAAMAEPLLLAPAFPGVARVTTRLAATRRDRFTAWLPMLRRPHIEGQPGAVHAEVRGWIDGVPVDRAVGAYARPARAAGAVAATAALWAGSGRMTHAGAGGLAGLIDDPGRFLHHVAGYGVALSTFEGSADIEAGPVVQRSEIN